MDSRKAARVEFYLRHRQEIEEWAAIKRDKRDMESSSDPEDARIRFYVKHCRIITEWAGFEQDLHRFYSDLLPDVKRLIHDQNDATDVRVCRTKTQWKGKEWCSVRLFRDEWSRSRRYKELDIRLEWRRPGTLDGATRWKPHLKCGLKSKPPLDGFTEGSKPSGYPETGDTWLGFKFIRHAYRGASVDVAIYRERLLTIIQKAWYDWAHVVDRALGSDEN